jgi:hypothetical protein
MRIDREPIEAHARQRLQGELNPVDPRGRLSDFKRFLKLETDRLRMRHRLGLGGLEIASARGTLKIDDPVGAISVHGVNGAWGVVSLGLFADGTYGDGWNGVAGTVKGLFYGDGSQLVAQLIETATCVVFVFVIAPQPRRAAPLSRKHTKE